ncbi:MAG: BREX system ATP-binding domain-containing protein [candidate division Zixibacteria bacterium]|nr:BREX system ATP-binding domain-containing protein [candidate division Zixibacteria bacterium]
MDQSRIATDVVESLRKGIPPQRGIHLYSVGNEKLMDGVKKFHLSGIGERGIIRFISGSWGVGKTHFFRQLREIAFENNCLVSSVELDVNSAALNKFQSVFSTIIRQIATPSYYIGQSSLETAPFGIVVRESLAWLATGTGDIGPEISYEQYSTATERLMGDHGIDIDFKKMIQKYWETYLPEAPDRAVVEQTRGEILQWFSGEGTVGSFRKRFGVSKIVSKENAKQMLQSLAGFVRLSGYKGLLILFDEAEQAYSVMRKSALRDAHNNLLSIINNIESLPGLFLIYATTPDFFSDPKHGIVIYGALSGRIGKPEERQPRALDTIWNLDAVETKLEVYQQAAKKIRSTYAIAYPEAQNSLPNEEDVSQKVAELFRIHPSLASVRFWRLLVTATITDFDDHMDGEPRATEQLYDNVMDRLRED